MGTNKVDLIRQALNAAESSIKLSRQLLAELELGKEAGKAASKDLPGLTGVFDGENMVCEDGSKYPVPVNYASKSMLVVGDTLKLIDEGGEKRFKQVEHVKRHKSVGMLTKKDGKFKVVTSEGSYKVLPAAVSHFGGKVGDEVTIQLPANNLTAAYAAIESVEVKDKDKNETVELVKKEAIPTLPVKVEKEEKAKLKNGPLHTPLEPQESISFPPPVENQPSQKPLDEAAVEVKMPGVTEDELR
jgi:hypothetical protein